MRPNFYTVHHGKQKLQVPRAWDTFLYHERRYRVHGGTVQTLQDGAWRESILLTISANRREIR